MILQKIKKSIEKIGIPCFLDYNDATSYCAVLIPETNGKESIKVDIQFIWEDGNPILLADEWIKSLRMNKELKAIVLGSENNYAGYVLRVKVIDVSICSYIPTGNRYTITIENDPAKGTVRGAGKYLEGKTCTLTAYPNEQYYFNGWLTPEDDVVHENPYSFTVDRDATYGTAYLSKYHVEVVSAGNGTVSGSGYFTPTESCTITATPNTGYHFVNWTVNGLELTTDNPYTFIPTGDITITANFAINTYSIATGGIGGTITGSGTYNYGATCTLTATPNAGYEFRRWMEYGETISTLNPYSFTVDSDRTITAVFNQINYTVSATSSGNGSVSGGGTYHYGDSITLTATPDEGYRFVNWTEGSVEVSTTNPYTFTCTGNRTIVGNFEEYVPLVINTKGNDSVILTNSSNQTYTWNLVEGENVYEGDVPGFALDEITGLERRNDYRNIISIDAIGLTSWTTIVNNAFYGCTGLTSITLPDSLTTIGNYAFYGCNSLASINSSNITTVGDYAFQSCNSLTSIDDFPNITTIGPSAFSYCWGFISITLPNSLTTIGSSAFGSCIGLNSITCLSITPPTLGSGAFDNTNNCLIYVPIDSVNDYKTAWSSYASRIVGNIPEPAEDNLLVECKNTSSVILTNSSNQTYTWNLSVGKNYYTGTEPGFAINEITGLTKGSSLQANITYIDASDLTLWTIIDSDAFLNCNSLASIILPDTIQTIRNQAFLNCSKLNSIILPDSLTTIGSDILTGAKIVSLNIPANVSNIAQRIGYNLSNLASITVDSNNQYYNDGNGSNCIIETATNKLMMGCKNTTIPNTIVEIGLGAFQGCTGLTSITLPNSLTSIESNSFSSCNQLQTLTIPASVNYIGTYAFNGCSGLTSITVNSNNQYYNDGNGSNCIIETATNKLIQGCNITVIPNTIVALGAYAFSGCRFTSINLPNSITSIGDAAFQSCNQLQTLTIPASVNYIGHTAFWGSNLWYMEFEGTTPATLGSNSIFSSSYPLYVPSSAVSAYQTAWPTYASRIMTKPEPSGSDYLRIDTSGNTEVILTNANNDTYTWTIPGSGINYYEGTEPGFALNEITGLKKSSRLQNSIRAVDASKLTSWTTVENSAFDNCQGLTSIILPNSITSIGNSAFNYCVGLTSIILSDSLISLGGWAMQSCIKLISITLPSTLTSIGTFAFSGSQGLTSITCLATTPPTLSGSETFNQTNNCPIYVPAASVNDYKTAQYWSSYASRIQAIPTP